MSKRRGRPPLKIKRVVIRTALTLYEGVDDDLIAFFENLSPRQYAAAIKQAMRAGIVTIAPQAADDDDLVDDFLV